MPPEVDSPVTAAQRHVDQGNAYFDKHEYESAIAEYTAALAISPHPDLLWNIARASEESGQLREALALFERYAAMAPTDADKATARAKIDALGRRLAKGTVTVTTEPGAAVSVGGVPVGVGPAVTTAVNPGRYRVKVTLEGRPPVEQFVTVGPSEIAQVALPIPAPAPVSPPAPPPDLTSWAGTFRVVAADDGLMGTTLDGAEVMLDANGKGRVRKPMTRPLEPWRREHCAAAHGDQLSWVALYDVSIVVETPASRLLIERGVAQECSCEPFCHFQDHFDVPALAVPGFRGVVTESVVLLRSDAPPSPLGRRTLPLPELRGEWVPILWPSAPASGARLQLAADGTGVLATSASGELLSWQRRSCGDRPDWAQTLAYPVTLTTKGARVRLAFGPGRETTCTCPGQCAPPAALASLDLWVPALPDALVAPQVLWVRPTPK